MANQIVISDDVQTLCDAILGLPPGIVIFDGFTGAGKSTQAKLVAGKLNCKYIDVDDYFGLHSDQTVSHEDLVRSRVAELREIVQNSLRSFDKVLIASIRAREVLKMLELNDVAATHVYVEKYLDRPILEHEVIEYHVATDPKKRADVIFRRKAADEIEAIDRLCKII